MNDDATLIQRAIDGDQEAFAALYESYFDRVFDFLARMVRNQQLAADLAQDTFLRALHSLPSLKDGSSFKSWIFTIARNTALNHIERASRQQPLHDPDDEEEGGFALAVVDTDRQANPEAALEMQSLANLVWEAAKALEPKQYSVLDLSVRQGLDSAEIAQVLGVSNNNAYVMVNRMKKTLEEAIGALMLFKVGRRSCSELSSLLATLGVPEMSPQTRRAIDRHAAKCLVCGERRAKMTSPFAILGGFAVAQPGFGIKAGILETVQTTFPYGFSGASGGTGSGADGSRMSSNGSGSEGRLDSSNSGDPASRSMRTDTPGASRGWPGASNQSTSTPIFGGPPELETGPDDGRKRKLAAAGILALLLLIGSLVGVSAIGKDHPSAVAPIAGAKPPEALTSTKLDAEPSATPIAPIDAEPIEAGETEEIAPAVEPPDPTNPIPVMPGPGQPGLANPTNGGGGGGSGGTLPAPPSGGAGNLQPPGSNPGSNPSTNPGSGATNPGSGGGGNVVSPPVVDGSTQQPLIRQPQAPACVASAPTASPSAVSFGPTETVKTIQITTTETCGAGQSFQVQAGSGWIAAVPASGSLSSADSAAVTLRVDRAGLAAGNNSGRVRVTTAGGSIDVQVTVAVVRIDIAPNTPPTPKTQQLVPPRTPTCRSTSIRC